MDTGQSPAGQSDLADWGAGADDAVAAETDLPGAG